MISRQTLGFLLALVAAMTAASLWRLSLLPDWTQLPFTGAKGPYIRHGLVLFVSPLCILVTTGLVYGAKFLVTGPDANLAPYKRMNRRVLLGVGVLTALMHGYIIGRSLGHGLSLNPDILSRGTIMICAILVMVQGNFLPKMPSVSARFRAFQLDDWQQKRSRRFSGRLAVFYGLLILAAAALLPTRTLIPTVVLLTPIYMGVLAWHMLRLKREPSPLS
jgi:hypothetical protein